MKTTVQKLGHRPGAGTLVWRLPEALRAELQPVLDDLSGNPSFRIAFARDRAELAEAAREVAAGYAPGGHLWLCYPKLSGRIRSDLTRDQGWEPIDALGLLAVAQVALDADWSALRFRLRGEIRVLTRKGEPDGQPDPSN